MKTFHDDEQLKADMLREVGWHREQDMLVKGTYGCDDNRKKFKGCAVGCAAHSFNRLRGTKLDTDDHKAIAESLGVPEWLMRLQDMLFEGLPQDESQQFPERFIAAMPVGVSAETLRRNVQAPFMQFVLRECREFALPDGKAAIDTVIGLWAREQQGGKPSDDDWSAACSAAWSAADSAYSAAYSAYSAARSAADSACSAAYSAYSAARSAADSACSAAWSAAYSAYSAAHSKFASELIRLLEGAR